MTFADARRALRNDETSCEALVSSFLEKIEAENERLNAFTHVEGKGLMNHARYLDSQRARGHAGPLTGLVLGVKDNICMKGRPASAGSRMLEDFSSLYDATAIARLREAGALFVGRTNCDEFAMGSSNETSHYGPVSHPDDEERVPGGSSGGSAAAVAAGLCHAALGSDTGGSIRQPAAFCGTLGLKPTYGRVSRFGLVAFASSFDVIGPLTKTAEDAALLLEAIAGVDSNDATSAPVEVPSYSEALTGSVQGIRIGLPKEYFADGLDAGIRSMIEEKIGQLEDEGAEVKEVSLPHTEYALAAYYVLATAEASSNLARYDGVRYGHRADLGAAQEEIGQERRRLESALKEARAEGETVHARTLQQQLDAQETLLDRLYAQSRTEGFGDEVKRRIMLGTYALSAGYYDQYYGKAQKVRSLIKNDFDRAFEEVDLLLTPVTPTPAFERGSKTDDPLEMYLSDVYTVPANLAGVPALSVPIGRHAEAPHLPVGMQLVGRHFDEALLLQAGDVAMRA